MVELTVSHLRDLVVFDRLLLLVPSIEVERSPSIDKCAKPNDMSSKRGRWQASFASSTKALTLLRIAGVDSSFATSLMMFGAELDWISQQSSTLIVHRTRNKIVHSQLKYFYVYMLAVAAVVLVEYLYQGCAQ